MRNVADLPAAAADEQPHRTAFVDPDGRTTTWSDVERRVAAAAGGLRAAGVAADDRVGVILPNGAAFAVAYWGVLRAGATVVPINPGYTPRERDHILLDAGAQTIVSDAPLDDMPAGVRCLPAEPAGGSALRSGTTGGGDTAVVCYTSGTTGRPKGALLSHDNLLANLDAFSDLPLLGLEPDDVLLGVLPFFHVFGLNVVLDAAARHGCTVAAIDRFSPSGTATVMIEHGVSIAYGAPPVFAVLAALPAEVRMPRLRAAVSGADALPVPTFDRYRTRWDIEILEGYGLTETSPVLASNAAATEVRPGTVGIPLPGVDIELRGPTGVPVDTGRVGEIHARGPNVFSGYHAQPDATAEVLHDGWFATGDLGRADADGYLSIVGRLKDMVIVSGFNVYPREVEEALLEHPDVADAVVVGMPDDRTGERVRAVVVPRQGAARVSPDQLIAHCRTRLARYKLPREVRVVETLPRMPTGKVARRLLRD